MSRRRSSRSAALAFYLGFTVAIATAGCALTNKGDALTIRYFTPESVKPSLTSSTTAPTTAPSTPSAQVELGRVTSGFHLRDKIAYRDAAYEVGYYDDQRWTERPEVFVRRELARNLFEEHHVRRALAGQAPVLDIEVIAFEEMKKTKTARIQLRMIIHDDRDSLLEKTITVDRPIPQDGPSIDGLIQAMADALNAASEEVVKETETVLRARPQSKPPTDPASPL